MHEPPTAATAADALRRLCRSVGRRDSRLGRELIAERFNVAMRSIERMCAGSEPVPPTLAAEIADGIGRWAHASEAAHAQAARLLAWAQHGGRAEWKMESGGTVTFASGGTVTFAGSAEERFAGKEMPDG